MPDKIKLPKIPEDGDNRDSSLIVYTLTISIAIALLVLVFTNISIFFTLIKIVASIALTASIILTFLAIENMVDITSFGYSSENTKQTRERKYKKILRNYNYSVIIIIGTIILLSMNFIVKLLLPNNLPICCEYGVQLGIIILTLFLSCIFTKKWQADIKYLKTVEFEDSPLP